MNVNQQGKLEISDALVQEITQMMRVTLKDQGQSQMETARQMLYQRGIVASSDDLRDLMLRARRLYATMYADTGI